MGSSGSGRISDYPGSSGGSGSGSGGDGGGDGPQDDRCARAFNVSLEDIQQSAYFKANGAPPPVGTQLTVVHQKRLVAQTTGGQAVGNLPTSLNYLAACMKSGWRYLGTVRATSNGPPAATVDADFVATPPP